MPLILPLNKAGKRADKANEAHMIAVAFKGLHVMIAEHNAQGNAQGRASVMSMGLDLRKAQAEALDRACAGDFAWRNAIEAGGKTILDYWDGAKVIYPPMLNHGNTSSKLSFLYYLGHSLPDVMQAGFEDYHEQLELATSALIGDDFWIINSLADVVE